MAALVAVLVPGLAWSSSGLDSPAFNSKYGTVPNLSGNCGLCHGGGFGVSELNPYAAAYYAAMLALGGRNATNSPIAFGNIESLDSDGDGITNIGEIANHYFPGNASDTPPSTILPGAPTGVSATAGNGRATVSFNPPSSNGGSAITFYTVTSSPGGVMVTGAAAPITVTELANGVGYTFTVKATTLWGTGTTSTASSEVTPAVPPRFLRSRVPLRG